MTTIDERSVRGGVGGTNTLLRFVQQCWPSEYPVNPGKIVSTLDSLELRSNDDGYEQQRLPTAL